MAREVIKTISQVEIITIVVEDPFVQIQSVSDVAALFLARPSSRNNQVHVEFPQCRRCESPGLDLTSKCDDDGICSFTLESETVSPGRVDDSGFIRENPVFFQSWCDGVACSFIIWKMIVLLSSPVRPSLEKV